MGVTTLRVADLAKFPAAGWVRVGEQIIRYTSKSAASGEGTLDGVPASGTGALLAPIAAGATLVNHPHLRGVSGVLYLMKRGDQVNVLAVQGRRRGASGPRRRRRRGRRPRTLRPGWPARADIPPNRWRTAQLSLYSLPEARVRFATRDLKVRSGKSITITLGPPTNLTGTFKIQRVVFSQFGYPDLLPLRTVEASSYLFTMDNLFRRLLVGTGSGV